jgi:hypothetical protein
VSTTDAASGAGDNRDASFKKTGQRTPLRCG